MLRLSRFVPDLEERHDFQDVDYVRTLPTRLHPDRQIVKGELQRVTYYAHAEVINSMVAYSDPIVEEVYVYTRDSDGFALYRDMTITWFREDGSPDPRLKRRRKYYSPLERIQEGKRRRKNVVDQLQFTVLFAIMVTEAVTEEQARQLGTAFLAHHDAFIRLYLDASDPAIVSAVQADSVHTWLSNELSPGVTIRDTITGELNVWS